MPTFIDQSVYDALSKAVRDGFDLVVDYEKKGNYISRYYDFPDMSVFDSGLPHFFKMTSLSDSSPKNYSQTLSYNSSKAYISSWADFIKLSKTHPRLRFYYDVDRHESNKSDQELERHFDYLNRSILLTVFDMVDRYIHINGKHAFDAALFSSIYQEWEVAAFAESLPVDILVPMIFVTCSFDELKVADNIVIERMEAKLQLARSTHREYTVAANESVIGGATHALVLKNWSVNNTSQMMRAVTLSSGKNFSQVIRLVDHLFAGLRVAVGVQTGYSQIVIRPIGWGDSWKADLPHVNVFSVRAYPDSFENFGWLRHPSLLNEQECLLAGSIYSALVELPSNKLLLASRRLNAAYLRQTEEDSILDITIGLETLLVGDSKSEITHKLAMRMAAMCKIRQFQSYSPSNVFDLCKRLYDYRSAVVHGLHNIEKKRVLRIENTPEGIPAIDLGLALLRFSIEFLTLHPEYLDSRRLDLTLLGT